MGRRDAQPFNSDPNTGRIGYRHDWEPMDERPLLYYPYPFWEDETERMTYEAAVEANTRREDEGAMTYMARISAAVEGRYKRAVQSMPHTRLSRLERDRQLQKLRGQMPSNMEIL